ncbi:hypothetical protein [Rubrivivax benzoatilyticus]|uniref:Uncharacterized protein n=1 Tax=Rubrivivax benzoatilyticus TaxID=316997 RepID=A0ABX0HTV5_9BURK|nr:hypothetical protein [Rubrivivax benzoatilyticus]EGJ10790.1 hypothetical protein RBXJA2T_10711 [Rubrivivax benzoatilyticus JA2 = ATCC BAA-35]NHK96780.1 hypothetical protein [Rubrivivax benzoatilyticus]NHL24495.1 hypothetical protein [Rubrivivax benzoatilyticus]
MTSLPAWPPSPSFAPAAAPRAAEAAGWADLGTDGGADAASRVLRAPADGSATPQALTARFLASLLAGDAGA